MIKFDILTAHMNFYIRGIKCYHAIILNLILLFSCGGEKQVVHSPVFVGRPPQNAYTGLVRLNDEEIRHYGKDLYIKSMDKGITWDTVKVSNGNLYGKKSPITEEYIRLFSGDNFKVNSARSVGGIDGKWITELVDSNGAIMLKPVVYIKNGSRAIVGFHTRSRNGCGTYYSDDNGLSWSTSNQVNVPHHIPNGFHKGQRWNHGAVEPSIVELSDGRLWMLIRTAQDNHYESYSNDGGEFWSDPVPSRFYGTITMPTLQRLKNGSILLLWCNTTPLPELEHDGGYWEDVFTNRDAIHAAISEDDGITWHGFREIYLNPLRNDSLMATRFGKLGSLDRSVHQSEVVELEDEKLIVSLGQHPMFRALIKMDINWLYEKERYDDFSDGLINWSFHKYINGIKDHCAYNRKPGAFLINHPDKTSGKVMHIRADKDTSLLYQNSGALFNFPAGMNGEISTRIKFNVGFDGLLISLHDRWFNSTDTVAQYFAMYNMEIPENLTIKNKYKINSDTWHDIKFIWSDDNNREGMVCNLFIDNNKMDFHLLPNSSTLNGISYIHFLLPIKNNSNEGILIESIETKVW